MILNSLINIFLINGFIMDKLMGYYLCDGKEFSSKIHACIHGTQNKKPVYWHFNNEIFDQYPWHTEPEESLDQLYDLRARQLREKYDYLVLAFSGGADSNNILESFLRQNLFIDEIVTNVMEEKNSFIDLQTKNMSSWNESAEFRLQTLPRLEHVRKVSPNTKISILDLSNYVFDFLNGYGDAGWLEVTRERLNVSGLMRHNFLHFMDIRKRFDKDKKIAMILGVEKPRTYIKDGIFKLMFFDKAINIATVQEFIEDYTNTRVEYFYSHPDAAKMICKQAHVIKKWLELFPGHIVDWTPDSLRDLLKKHRLIHERELRSIIYTTWDTRWWQSDKSTKDWFSQIDDWFTKGHQNSRAYHVWEEGLNYVKANASDYLMPEDVIGLKPFMHTYNIGPMKKFQDETNFNF
jgi:hypothetical protein